MTEYWGITSSSFFGAWASPVVSSGAAKGGSGLEFGKKFVTKKVRNILDFFLYLETVNHSPNGNFEKICDL